MKNIVPGLSRFTFSHINFIICKKYLDLRSDSLQFSVSDTAVTVDFDVVFGFLEPNQTDV